MSLRARLMLAFGYVLLFVVIALEVPLALNFSRRIDSEVRSEASTGAQAVAAAASGRLRDRAALDALVLRQARDAGGRVLVVDAIGRVLADSAGGGLRGAAYGTRPEIAGALQGRVTQGARHSASLGEDILYTAVPVVERGHTRGAVRVTQSVGAVHRKVRKDILALIGLGAAVMAIGLGLAWAIAGSLSRPLRRLASTARRIAGGDLGARADETGSAEQVEVAHAFNDMTGRLVRALDVQREFVANASHQLRTPLTGLRLRLEAAGLKARGDDALRRDLTAAEHEAERLGKLVTDLLSLAQDGQRPRTAVPVSLRDAAGRAADRWAEPAALAGTSVSWRAPPTPGPSRLGGRRRHDPRRADRERVALRGRGRAGLHRGGARARAGRARPRPGAGAGRGRARLRALLPRQREPPQRSGHGPGADDRRDPRAALGRIGRPRRPARRRRPGRGALRARRARAGARRGRARGRAGGAMRAPLVVALAVVGLLLSVAFGLAANAISRDSIGLAPRPSGATLAPPAAATRTTATRPPPRPARHRRRKHRRSATTTVPVPVPVPVPAPAPAPPAAPARPAPPATTTTHSSVSGGGGDDSSAQHSGSDD